MSPHQLLKFWGKKTKTTTKVTLYESTKNHSLFFRICQSEPVLQKMQEAEDFYGLVIMIIRMYSQ